MLPQTLDQVTRHPIHVLEVFELFVGQGAGVGLAIERLLDAMLERLEKDDVGIIPGAEHSLGFGQQFAGGITLAEPSQAEREHQIDVGRRLRRRDERAALLDPLLGDRHEVGHPLADGAETLAGRLAGETQEARQILLGP